MCLARVYSYVVMRVRKKKREKKIKRGGKGLPHAFGGGCDGGGGSSPVPGR